MLIHDSVVCDIAPQYVDEFIPLLRGIMEGPFDQVVKGFMCPVDIEVGPNWGELTKYVKG